ncbi:MAG TPA: hypothetical protein VHU81_20960 [Thermoanaerobaculia bacterium]|jgi:tetratricopeptide (TPR) repeat protein|nr:hypothetical protein [Thermoanaerobaculia bacterium]
MGENDEGRPASLSVTDPTASEGGEGTGALLERLARVRETLGRERSEAPGRVDELLEQPEEVRLGLASLDPRFHTWGVCELLLLRSQAVGETDRLAAGHLARLCLAASEGLAAGSHATAVVKDLRAKAWAGVGEACLQTGDREGADEALRAAATCLAYGTGDLLVEARLLEFEAAVRADQGRAGEAEALLDQAAERYREICETADLERVLRRKERLGG